MSLFNLIKKHNGIGLAADLFRELARLVITDIAGRRTNDARDGEFLHEFGHVQPDQALRAVKHVGGKSLDQLGLSDTGAAHEDKAHRFALDLESDPSAPNRGTDRVHRLVLTDDVLFQACVEPSQTFQLIFFDRGGRNLGPEFDDAGQVIHGQFRSSLCVELLLLLAEAKFLAAQFRNAGVARLRLLLGIGIVPMGIVRQQGVRFEADVLQLALHQHAAVDIRVLQVHIRAGLIQQVNGLVRQEAICDVALTHGDGLLTHLIGDLHAVIILIVMRDAAQDGDAVLDGRFVHRNRLETALQSGVLFDVLAVFGEGRRADHLDLTAGKRGL